MSDAPRRDLVERMTYALLDTIVTHPDFEVLQIREIISSVASLLVTLVVHVAGKYVPPDSRTQYRQFMAAELRQIATHIETGLYEDPDATTVIH